jgi:NADPH-dependent 2,4-dienoyl-CoA reductase/sulfur reductase-like enzyme
VSVPGSVLVIGAGAAGDWEPDRVMLRKPEAIDALNAQFILGDPAVSLDAGSRVVRTGCGRTLRADAIVIATGPQPRPLDMQFGPLVSGLLADLHTAHGVTLRLGTGVEKIEGPGDPGTGDGPGAGGTVSGVRLTGGEVIPADLVIVAVGGIPETGWLTSSGLTLDNGIVCDKYCRASDGVYAAGDVARWHHERLAALLRLENRTNATEQAVAVAAAILGEDEPYSPVPYMWTDQLGVKIQVHGTLRPDAEVTITDGSLEPDPDQGNRRRFVARFTHDGRPAGVLGWNMPRQTTQRRRELLSPS